MEYTTIEEEQIARENRKAMRETLDQISIWANCAFVNCYECPMNMSRKEDKINCISNYINGGLY